MDPLLVSTQKANAKKGGRKPKKKLTQKEKERAETRRVAAEKKKMERDSDAKELGDLAKTDAGAYAIAKRLDIQNELLRESLELQKKEYRRKTLKIGTRMADAVVKVDDPKVDELKKAVANAKIARSFGKFLTRKYANFEEPDEEQCVEQCGKFMSALDVPGEAGEQWDSVEKAVKHNASTKKYMHKCTLHREMGLWYRNTQRVLDRDAIAAEMNVRVYGSAWWDELFSVAHHILTGVGGTNLAIGNAPVFSDQQRRYFKSLWMNYKTHNETNRHNAGATFFNPESADARRIIEGLPPLAVRLNGQGVNAVGGNALVNGQGVGLLGNAPVIGQGVGLLANATANGQGVGVGNATANVPALGLLGNAPVIGQDVGLLANATANGQGVGVGNAPVNGQGVGIANDTANGQGVRNLTNQHVGNAQGTRPPLYPPANPQPESAVQWNTPVVNGVFGAQGDTPPLYPPQPQGTVQWNSPVVNGFSGQVRANEAVQFNGPEVNGLTERSRDPMLSSSSQFNALNVNVTVEKGTDSLVGSNEKKDDDLWANNNSCSSYSESGSSEDGESFSQ